MFYYYQIKGRSLDESHTGNWMWPPLFSGMVEAHSKEDAKSLIEAEYEKKFPLRVLSKDLEKHNYLIHIRLVDNDDKRTMQLFDSMTCKECASSFRIIDKYNDANEPDKGREFCSHACRNTHVSRMRIIDPVNPDKQHAGFIYKITNTKEGMSYVGKTTQPFTLRWYQHFYQGNTCKFHKAIKKSNLTDWTFQIIEIVIPGKGQSPDDALRDRENFWIMHFKTIDNGYNSAQVKNNKIQ